MKCKSQRILYQHGDRELFYAEGNDMSWRLPLFIDWRHDRESDQMFAHVTPAVCLYYNQSVALNTLLNVHDIQGRKDSWLITKRICEALLHKAPGITPACYYRWPDADAPPIPVKPPLRTRVRESGSTPLEKSRPTNDPIRRSFIEWVAKERKIQSSIINAVLSAVAEEGPTWMLLNRKPIDLGFCRLVAVPFRANWKEIVAFKAKASGMKLRALFNLPRDEVEDALESAGLPAMLTSPHNVGLRRGWRGEVDVARIDYTIEAIPTEAFETAANRIEGERMARGAAAYVAEFENAVEAVYQTAILALRSYLKKVSAPFAQVLSGRNPGIVGFMPVLGKRVAVRGTPLSNLPVHVIDSGSRFSVYGRSSDQFLVSPPAPEVPKVPDLLSAPPDVRERTVDGQLQLVDGEGSDRMSLPPSDQSRPEGEPVLAESTPAGAGLDGAGDRLI